MIFRGYIAWLAHPVPEIEKEETEEMMEIDEGNGKQTKEKETLGGVKQVLLSMPPLQKEKGKVGEKVYSSEK